METINFDYIVIGAGSGGIASANRAAQYGKKVLVIEEKVLGGTCVNVGCVPKKIMWNAANIADTINKYSKDYGFDSKISAFNFETLLNSRQKYISNIHNSYAKTFNNNGITIVHGTAKFVNSKELEVNGNLYSAPHILIATGGRPVDIDIPGGQYGINSNGFFELEKVPEKVAIVGAGYIAVELAGILNSLGAEVDIVIRNNYPLRTFDRMISKTVKDNLKDSGVNIHTYANPAKVTKEDGSYIINLSDGRTIETDLVIWAIGRTPSNNRLGLSATEVNIDENGYIIVDKFQNTTVNGIYALGDNTKAPQLTPVAVAKGRALAERLFNEKENLFVDTTLVPTVVFTHPPVGTIGLTEEQACKKYGKDNLSIYYSKFTSMLSAVTSHKEACKMKIICVGENEKVIGFHGVGLGMDEILQGFAVAIKMGATKADLDSTIAIHPTAAEEFVTMKKKVEPIEDED
ncbi:MAG: glutathione-disulfide reductase [Psittacicella sp.]